MTSLADMAARFGLKRSGCEWRGMCPACGYGGGAFVLSAGRGGGVLAWCASCQDRAAIARLMDGDALPPATPAEAARSAATKARKAERAISLYRGAGPIPGTPAALYLAHRGIGNLMQADCLRFRPDTPHPAGGQLPAMLAAVADVSGAIVAVHRTFLAADGRKADVEPVKASLGPIWGGAIRLSPIVPNMPVVIGEGVETSASAGHLMGFPAWAAISAGNMAKGLVLPAEVRRVVIAADPDEPGRRAAREAWCRWNAEGRHVEIAIPDDGRDFNDLLIAREPRNA